MALREEFWPWDGQPQEPTRPSDSAIKAGLQTLNNFATGNRSVFGAQVFSQVGSGHVRAGTLVGIGAANGGTGRLQASNLTVVAPPSSADFAVLLQFALNATGQTNKYAVYQKHSFSFDQTAIIYGYVANSFEFYTSGHGGSDPRTGSQIAVSDTRPHTLIYTYGGGVWSGWLDGVQAFVTARTFSLSSSSLDSSWLFDVDSPAATLNATVLTHATFARGLSDSLAREFSATPGKLYEPRRIWVPVSAGGGATDLILADATHGHAADNLVLTTSTALSIQDATHAHTADSLTLSVQSVLTVADALHAHAADSLVLTLDSTLAVAEALHAHAADSLVLTTDSVLAVADSSHSHTADALIFTVQSVLAIQEALHSHTADNIVLGVTDTTNLAIADATHGHAADALILTVQSVLTIQESLHVHSVDNLVLGTTGAANLTIADAIHSHTVDSLSLTAQSVLTIQEALHAHTADSLLLETTGQVTLLIADAVHGHFVDSISLSSTHVLAISDAIHTHAADNINLSYELSLLIADSLHSHYADNLIVSGEPVLAIDDALHLHYADALTLSTATWLVIQEAMHAHHSDNVILTFGGIGTSALVTGAILVDRKFVTSIVNAQIIGRLFDRLDS